MSESKVATQAARAMLSILDQHIKDLRAKRWDTIPSNKQFYTYAFPEFESAEDGVYVESTLATDEDAAFVATAMMILQNGEVGDDDTNPVSWFSGLSLTDSYTGRQLVWGRQSNGAEIDFLPLQMLPNSRTTQVVPYTWFDLPAEFLCPRAAALRSRLYLRENAENVPTAKLLLLGYKVYQE